MKVDILENNQIDKDKWNQLIYYHADGLPYFHSDYLDQVCDWKAMVFGDYQAVMPLPFKSKYGLQYLYTPFLIQQLGLISEATVNVDKWYRKIPRNFKLVELNSNELNPQGEKQTNTVLDLNSSYDDLVKNYSTNHKRNLKKVGDLELRQSNVKDVFQLFLQSKGTNIKGFNEDGLLKLLTLIKHTPFKWEVDGAYLNDELLAGAIWVKTHSRIVFLFSGNSEKGKENRALLSLIDKKIQKYSNSNLKLDFEGSNNVNLARFYKGFGAEHCVYGKYTRYLFPVNLIKRK